MVNEKSLVLIKPDAVQKGLSWNILNEIQTLNLKISALKLVKVPTELAELHYEEHKEKPFFQELIDHITGKLHGDSGVVAIVYEGEDAIKKIRNIVGATNPDKAEPNTIRGKYGRIHSITNCHETAIHASDSVESALKEISLWFKDEELN